MPLSLFWSYSHHTYMHLPGVRAKLIMLRKAMFQLCESGSTNALTFAACEDPGSADL
jgi:hypothetical protein